MRTRAVTHGDGPGKPVVGVSLYCRDLTGFDPKGLAAFDGLKSTPCGAGSPGPAVGSATAREGGGQTFAGGSAHPGSTIRAME